MKVVMSIIVFVLFIGAIWAFVAAKSLMVNSASTVNIISPKEGIKCATLVTQDGAAIDCWETKNVVH